MMYQMPLKKRDPFNQKTTASEIDFAGVCSQKY